MSIWKWEPLAPNEEQKILKAIAAAELNTSGEIRVHIDKWCKTDPLFKAQNMFTHLKMEETEHRNGVLIYVALKEKKFAIVGDTGINARVPNGFWDSTKTKMIQEFAMGNIVSGICEGITEAGEQLQAFFPYQRDDVNELPDDISYG
ncbi:MAG: TPM domain-containing protein [Bacteroidetes bacterium]|jgi:uncharacterized membrane protein|nr:TPM domain-containing protein [Bacteroidota bacterium]